MSFKNYSTQVPLDRTIAEIEHLLITHGATYVLKEYSDGMITSINFIIQVEGQKMPVKLPLDMNALQTLLKEQKKEGQVKKLSHKELNDINVIRRIGWRFLKDWLQAQMDYADMNQRKLEQIFLADIYDSRSGKTLFQVLQERKFAGMLAPPTEGEAKPRGEK